MSNSNTETFNKIKSLTLSNFKAYGEKPVTFKFSDINLIFGRNSSGKSTALQALKYFGSVLSGNERNNVESFDKILNYQAKEEVIDIRLDFYPLKDIDFFSRISRSNISSNLFHRAPYISIKIEKDKPRKKSGNYIRVKECILGYDNIPLITDKLINVPQDKKDNTHYKKREIILNYEHPIYIDEINQETILKFINGSESKMTKPLNEHQTERLKHNIILDKLILPVVVNSLKEYSKLSNKKKENKSKIKQLNNKWKEETLSNDTIADVIDPHSIYSEIEMMKTFDFDTIPTLNDFHLVQDEIPISKLCGRSESDKFSLSISRHRNTLVRSKLNGDKIKDIDKKTTPEEKHEIKQNEVNFFLIKPIEILIDLLTDVPENLSTSIHIGPLRTQVQNITSFNKDKHTWYDGTSAYYTVLDKAIVVLESINDDLLMISENNAYKIAIDSYKLEKTEVSDSDYLYNNVQSLVLISDSKKINDFSQVGTGISQALPIIVALQSQDKILIIEQPELHLHPAATVELASMFIRALSKGNQIFIETHSEHIILRILRLIREKNLIKRSTPLNPSYVSITYIDLINGKLVPVNLPITDDGDFVDDWPQGFFDERMKELF